MNAVQRILNLKSTPARPILQILGCPSEMLKAELAKHYDLAEPIGHSSSKPPNHRRGERLQHAFQNADAVLALPDADPYDLICFADEREVRNPITLHRDDPEISLRMLQEERSNPDFIDRHRKPLVLIGTEEDWKPFADILTPLAERGMLRHLFEKLFPRRELVSEAVEFIDQRVQKDDLRSPAQKKHEKALHFERLPEPETFVGENPVAQRLAPTIAFMGSASTKDSQALADARRAAEICADNGWNIIHGGGSAGVMGALTNEASHSKRKLLDDRGQVLRDDRVYVHGISAHAIGAHLLAGIEKEGADESRHTLARNMNRRIRLFNGGSQATVILGGGIGSVRETLENAANLDLIHHPSMSYEDMSGALQPKPLILVNRDGMYDGLLHYLESRPELKNTLRKQLIVVPTPDAMAERLTDYFRQHPPAPSVFEESLADRLIGKERNRANKPCWAKEIFEKDSSGQDAGNDRGA